MNHDIYQFIFSIYILLYFINLIEPFYLLHRLRKATEPSLTILSCGIVFWKSDLTIFVVHRHSKKSNLVPRASCLFDIGKARSPGNEVVKSQQLSDVAKVYICRVQLHSTSAASTVSSVRS